jgi:REP element-mobilizing transposase RayT
MNTHDHLLRLEPGYYRAFAIVHWTMTVDERATGWLDERFHLRWREFMLHAVARYEMFCPAYCLMPDHAHLVWMGVSERSDQRNAMKFFRTQTSPLLTPLEWQRQPHDHVLRDQERKTDAFPTICHYVLANPVRKGLVEKWQDYPFLGAMVPGYPTLDPRAEDFWDTFWRIYNSRVDEARSHQ